MIKQFKKFWQERIAASAVEFALLAPIFVTLLLGTADIGLYITNNITVRNIAGSVAEYVASSQDDANIETVAMEMYGGDFEDVTLSSEFECECEDGVIQACPLSCEGDGDYQRRFVNVTASSSYESIFLYPILNADGMQQQTSVRMRVD